MPNFKFVAQVVFEIPTMKYFGGHLGIEDSAPWGPKFNNWNLGYNEHRSVAQIVSELEILKMKYFGGHLRIEDSHSLEKTN